jgi:DnaK suppressor protein
MNDKVKRFDNAFIQAKRQELLRLRDALRRTSNAAELEESYLRIGEAREFEDDAEGLDALEREGLLVKRSVLAKIADGTYGYSDESGERIPDDRLHSLPDAINTQREQEIAEREAEWRQDID